MTAQSDGSWAKTAGPAFAASPEQPPSLAHYVAKLIEINRDGELIEIDRYGRQHAARYGQLQTRAYGISRLLGTEAGTSRRTAVLCFDGVLDHVAAAWGCLFAGIDFLPWGTAGLLADPAAFSRELTAVVDGLNAPLILADGAVCRALERTGPAARPRAIDVGGTVRTVPGDQPVCLPSPSEASNLLISTSGTGGAAKLAILDNRSAMNRFFDGVRQDRRVCLYNLAHHSVAGVRLLLPIGRRVIYFHPLRLAADPDHWLRAVADYSVTDVGMSSSVAAILGDAMAERPADGGGASLERISFGAEVIVAGVIRRLLLGLRNRGAGNLVVSLVYSMTETGPIYRSILPIAELLPLLDHESGPIALRNCVAGWHLSCVDDSGRLVREDEPGIIQVSSNSKLFAGYHGEHPGCVQAERRERWFDTGDVGSLRDGTLTIKGREKSTIIVNARKITCEEIETHLARCDGLERTAIVAAPYRTAEQSTDDIAVFFVPADNDRDSIARTARSIVAAISRRFGLSVRHVVPIAPDDIDRTATMKVRRDSLVQKYKAGKIQDLTGDAVPPINLLQRTDEAAFLRKWRHALGLSRDPGMGESFFDLGGDSLAAARLISAVENGYKVRLAVEKFFEEPTAHSLWHLVQDALAGSRGQTGTETVRNARQKPDVVRAIASLVSGWKGDRLFDGSLLVGFNTHGTARPIVWVFQSFAEASSLAGALGPNQPLYALRSAVQILPTKHYTEETLTPLLDRYLWEMLAVLNDRSFKLGGNCQAGIIALFLAQRLQRIGRPPARLILVDWSFDHGTYDGPVRVLMGEASDAQDKVDSKARAAALRTRFPRGRVRSIPGHHGTFFLPPNVGELAARLTSRTEPAKSGNRRLASGSAGSDLPAWRLRDRRRKKASRSL